VIVVVPGATPFTTPVTGLTEATVTVLLLHMPELVASLKVVVPVPQTDAAPSIGPGEGSIVTTVVVAPQPEDRV
jgi:hypothetical protein